MRRPFLLMVDSGSPDEPQNRYFASLERALEEHQKYNETWQRFSWIIHVPTNEIYMRDGKMVDSPATVRYS